MSIEMNDPEMMHQSAPFPTLLSDLVHELDYRPQWTVVLTHKDRGQGSVGLTLIINTVGYNSYHPERGQTYGVAHYFIVPAAAYNRNSWMNWLLECYQLVERHECCEFFTIGGVKPYAPHHGPGEDPYIVWHEGDEIARRTSFRGELNPV